MTTSTSLLPGMIKVSSSEKLSGVHSFRVDDVVELFDDLLVMLAEDGKAGSGRFVLQFDADSGGFEAGSRWFDVAADDIAEGIAGIVVTYAVELISQFRRGETFVP